MQLARILQFLGYLCASAICSNAIGQGVVYPDQASAMRAVQQTPSESSRSFRRPPDKTTLRPWMSGERLIVKFAEGSEVRIRNGRLASLAGKDMGAVQSVLARLGIPGSSIEPVFDRPEAQLAAERSAAVKRGGRELADLSLYYLIELRGRRDIVRVADELNSLSIVESARPQALPAPSPTETSATPDFSDLQGYKSKLSGGIGVDAVANVPGVDGAGLTLVDIEYGWELDHEDLQLPETAIINGAWIPIDPFPPANHGTAVLGMLVGQDNGYGVTGLVPAATMRVVGQYTQQYGYNPALAINEAAANLQPGDVILLEMQTWVCGTGEYGPVEWLQEVFDAVQHATALGIVVVAVAGNGDVNLDRASCFGLFDRSVRDSGAIIVGAGTAGSNSRTYFSTYGSRVDVQGWGNFAVTTLGYGDLYETDSDDIRDQYTNTFSGTSSASPMVAGAAIAIQGALLASEDDLLDSFAMRELLTRTGVPQGAGNYSGHIGPLPDVLAALTELYDWKSINFSPTDDTNFLDVGAPQSLVSIALHSTSVANGDAADFNVFDFDYTTARFGPAAAQPVYPISYDDTDGDGDTDIRVSFRIGRTGIFCEDTAATFTGETYGGDIVRGNDSIDTPDCAEGICHQ